MRLEKRKAILEIDLKGVFPLEISDIADRREFAFAEWGLERIERFHRRPSIIQRRHRLKQHQSQNLPLLSCPRENLHAVVRRIGGVPVEQPFGQTFQRATQKQDYRGKSDRDPQHKPVTESADETKYRAHPNRRGCR